jgi:hypothetical protein
MDMLIERNNKKSYKSKQKLGYLKIDLSFLTYAITLSNKPKESNKILLGLPWLHLLCYLLWNPLVTWMGFAMNY